MVHGTNGQVGACLPSKRNARVERLPQGLARQVHATGASREPAKPALARRVVGILPGAHARLAQVVHARPHKVANEPRLLLYKVAEPLRIGAEGLATQDQAVRVGPQVVLVAVDAVVVAGNVHLRVGVTRDTVACGQRRPQLHDAFAEKPRQPVVELAAHRAVRRGLLLCRLLRLKPRLLVGVLSHPQRAQQVEEDVHSAGHGTCGVQGVQMLHHLAGEKDASLLRRLGNLVANRVEHDAGMVPVLLGHVGKVATPPRVEVVNVVVEGLVDVPVIHVLVHDQNAKVVACVKQRLRARVVGGAHGVVALLAHEQDLAPLRVGKGAGAKHAVVVVDAGTAQHDAVAIEKKPVIAPGKGADATERLAVVGAAIGARKIDAAAVEVRMLRRPGTRRAHVKHDRPGTIRAQLNATGSCGLRGRLGEQLDRRHTRAGCLERNLDAGMASVQRERSHHDAIWPQVNRLAHPQRNGPVDSRPRVPAAVGLIGVLRNNPQLTGLAGRNPLAKVHVEVRVAIRPLGHKRPIYPHLRKVVDPLELEGKGLAEKIFGRHPGLDVLVVVTLEPSAVPARDRLRAARLANHRVVGKRDLFERRVLLACGGNPPEPPSVVERLAPHRAPSISHVNVYVPHPTSCVAPSGRTTSHVVPRGTSTSSEKTVPSSFQLLASLP